MDGAPACPFVAFGDDRDGRSTSPDHRHRCFAESPPAPRAVAHQEAYCLSSAFPVCPTFQDWARREAAHARGAGVPAETAPSAVPAADTADDPYDDDPAPPPRDPADPPVRRNPPRDWAAPPPWAVGAAGAAGAAGGAGAAARCRGTQRGRAGRTERVGVPRRVGQSRARAWRAAPRIDWPARRHPPAGGPSVGDVAAVSAAAGAGRRRGGGPRRARGSRPRPAGIGPDPAPERCGRLSPGDARPARGRRSPRPDRPAT